ncbi:hypothetical protein ACIQUM_33480 [Amycolatopsis azurea]|uniref:hypothetical protein n=1 Tax=Amycolatopsis azurea TaxID=36819 RepID=UPI0038215849
MASTSKREKPENAVHRVHARNGLWQDGLARALGPELRRIWGIADDAEPGRVREIVLVRLNRVLVGLNRPEMPAIVWAAYNVGVSSPGEESGSVERLNRLIEEGGVKRSFRTCTRRLDEFLQAVKDGLSAVQEPITDEELGWAARKLAENSRHDAPEPAGLSAAIRRLRAPVEPVLKMFLDDTVHGPADGDGVPLTAKLGAGGEWFCVFTEERLLAGYRESTGANWPRTERWAGRDVVRTAAGRIFPTGVLINPSPVAGTGIDATLPLPPDEIARLAREC